MTIEELLKQQPQLGQGGASQYLYGPQQQYGGAGQYLGGLLSTELNFNAPTGTIPNYTDNTYHPTQMTNQQQYLNSWTPATLIRMLGRTDSPQLQLFSRLAPFAEQIPYTRTTF